jgi:hypothetical protein
MTISPPSVGTLRPFPAWFQVVSSRSSARRWNRTGQRADAPDQVAEGAGRSQVRCSLSDALDTLPVEGQRPGQTALRRRMVPPPLIHYFGTYPMGTPADAIHSVDQPTLLPDMSSSRREGAFSEYPGPDPPDVPDRAGPTDLCPEQRHAARRHSTSSVRPATRTRVGDLVRTPLRSMRPSSAPMPRGARLHGATLPGLRSRSSSFAETFGARIQGGMTVVVQPNLIPPTNKGGCRRGRSS